MSKKNSEDFDFIKNKFDEAEPEVPQALNESVIEYKVLSKAEHNTIKIKRNRMPAKAFLSAAACFVLVIGLLFAVYPRIERNALENGANIPAQQTGSTVSTFKSYKEIYRYIDKSNSKYANMVGEISEGIRGGSSYSETYLQVDGIDEADVVKVNGEYIFCSDNNNVLIYKAENGDAALVNTIPIGSAGSDWDDKHTYIQDMYLTDNILVVNAAASRWAEISLSEKEQKRYNTEYIDYSYNETKIMLYDISNPENAELISEFTQSGYYNSSRLINGTEYIVTNHRASAWFEDSRIPYTIYNNEKTELPAENIAYFDNTDSCEYVVVSAIDIYTGELVSASKAVLGASDDIYCNSSNMYITNNLYNYEFAEVPSPDDHDEVTVRPKFKLENKTQIIKLSVHSNQLEFLNTATVDGYVDNQFSMDEKDGLLRIATTTSNENGTHNNLFILDESLNMVGGVTGFAEDESIRAVRFIDNMAYVITFEQTDPLFVIDLSNPEKPEIKGEVKITGFSSQLVPVDEDTLLGIGIESDELKNGEVQEGLKLVLFDISDSENPKILDSKVLEDYYSSAMDTHKAIVINKEKGYYALPYWKSTENFSEAYNGVLTFEINKNKIKITNEFKKGKDENTYLERCVYIGDYIYSFDSDYNVYSYLYE